MSRLDKPDADVIAPPRANLAQRTPRELVSKRPTIYPHHSQRLYMNQPPHLIWPPTTLNEPARETVATTNPYSPNDNCGIRFFSMNLWSSPFLGVPLAPPPWRSRASAVHDGNDSSAEGNFLSIVTSIRNKKGYEVNITVRIRKFVRPLLPYHERINENLPFHWQHLTRHPCDSEKHGTTPHHPYYLRLKTFACRLSQ